MLQLAQPLHLIDLHPRVPRPPANVRLRADLQPPADRFDRRTIRALGLRLPKLRDDLALRVTLPLHLESSHPTRGRQTLILPGSDFGEQASQIDRVYFLTWARETKPSLI